MKILLDKWVRISHGEHQGKIFQLRYLNTMFHAAYFPGPPEVLISIDELNIVSPPFPYWRSRGDGMMYRIEEPNTERCDILPIVEQISRSADRSLKIRTHIKLHKEAFKQSNKRAGKWDVFKDPHYKYLEKERQDEVLLANFLKSVVPVPEMARDELNAIASKFQHLAPTKRGGNIPSSDVEEILKPTQPQEKTIFPPRELPDKKGGRPRGTPNNKHPNGWLDVHYNLDGTTRHYYCRHEIKWATKKTRVPDGKVESVRKMIEAGYSVAQIEDSID